MKKLSLLKATFAAAALGMMTSSAAVAEDQIAVPAHGHQALADLICAQAKDHKYVLLGDTDHGSSEINQAAFSDAVLRAIKDCTEADVYVLEGAAGEHEDFERGIDQLERSYKLSADLDLDIAAHNYRLRSLMPGSDEYRATTERIAALEEKQRIEERMREVLYLSNPDFMKHKRIDSFGLNARYYDPRYEQADQNQDLGLVRDILFDSYTEIDRCITLSLIHSTRLHADTPSSAMRLIEDFLNFKAFAADDEIAQAIMTNHPGGAVVIYGAGHYRFQQGDIDDRLGAENVVVIDIKESRQENDAVYDASDNDEIVKPKLFPNGFAERDDEPDYIYYAQEGEIEAIDPGAQDQEPVFTVMTRDEFAECKAAMPERVREAFRTVNGEVDPSLPDFTYEDYLILIDPEQGLPPVMAGFAPAPAPDRR